MKRRSAEPLLRRGEASDYLRREHGLQRAASTLAKDACSSTGEGPPFKYINRIPYYWPSGLDDWVRTVRGRPRVRAKKYDPPRIRRQQQDLAPTESQEGA
jgi:hypothetical protein